MLHFNYKISEVNTGINVKNNYELEKSFPQYVSLFISNHGKRVNCYLKIFLFCKYTVVLFVPTKFQMKSKIFLGQLCTNIIIKIYQKML